MQPRSSIDTLRPINKLISCQNLLKQLLRPLPEGEGGDPGPEPGWGLFPLHVERNRHVVDAFARFHHLLRGLGVFLEMRRFQVSLERIGAVVNFK